MSRCQQLPIQTKMVHTMVFRFSLLSLPNPDNRFGIALYCWNCIFLSKISDQLSNISWAGLIFHNIRHVAIPKGVLQLLPAPYSNQYKPSIYEMFICFYRNSHDTDLPRRHLYDFSLDYTSEQFFRPPAVYFLESHLFRYLKPAGEYDLKQQQNSKRIAQNVSFLQKDYKSITFGLSPI